MSTYKTVYKKGPYKIVRENFRVPCGARGFSLRIEGPGADKLRDTLVPDGFENLELIIKRANIGYQAGRKAIIQNQKK